MKTIKVKCITCGKEFEKELKRYNYSIKNNKPHTCSRKCASKISNTKRISEPSSDFAWRAREQRDLEPEKIKARNLVKQAIKCGKIERPKKCEYCEKTCIPDAHHPNHSQPYFLVFLCKECHRFFDKNKIFGFGKDYSKEI